MAIITKEVTDILPVPQSWEMPPSPDALRSPVPRGLITFSGIDPIALLGSGDQTAYQLNLIMPPGFAYLLKRCYTMFDSDDLTNDFNNLGEGFYNRASVGPVAEGSNGNTRFTLVSQGEQIISASLARRIWSPILPTPKLLLQEGDIMGCFLVDMSADASTAGDMIYQWEYYVFDVDQIDKWEVNTPIPTISHTSF